MQITEKIDTYLNEATNMKKLKDDLARLFDVTKQSMKFQDGVMEIAQVFSGAGSVEEADSFIKEIKSLLKNHDLKKQKVSVDTMYDVVETYVTSKGDTVVAIEREDMDERIYVYCNLYKKR